jgi:glycosyltransferase involved in cell wall biosynthesis
MYSLFALCFDGRLNRELTACGCAPAMLGRVRLSRPRTVWRARRSLAVHLSRHPVDVVVCHQAWPYVIFRHIIRSAGLPVVFWLHTVSQGWNWLDSCARVRQPDLAVSSSRFAAEWLSRWFPTARVEWIYCPLAAPLVPGECSSQRERVRRSLETASDDLVVVQVGRLEALKGHLRALEALARLRDVGNWKYWIVGGPQRWSDERYLRRLKTAARRLGIGHRVRFLGERFDVPTLLQASDVYCQPNVRPEAFGLALVEALGAGLPVVTSDLGGAREIVDASCGLLTPPHDVGALASALRHLMINPEARHALGREALNRPGALCDATRQMKRIEQLLGSVIRPEDEPHRSAAVSPYPGLAQH